MFRGDLAIDFFLYLFQNLGGNCLRNVLRIKCQHPDLALPDSGKIYHTHAAAFAAPGAFPAELPDATASRDQVPDLGIFRQTPYTSLTYNVKIGTKGFGKRETGARSLEFGFWGSAPEKVARSWPPTFSAAGGGT
jgi:hypothetical protein